MSRRFEKRWAHETTTLDSPFSCHRSSRDSGIRQSRLAPLPRRRWAPGSRTMTGLEQLHSARTMSPYPCPSSRPAVSFGGSRRVPGRAATGCECRPLGSDLRWSWSWLWLSSEQRRLPGCEIEAGGSGISLFASELDSNDGMRRSAQREAHIGTLKKALWMAGAWLFASNFPQKGQSPDQSGDSRSSSKSRANWALLSRLAIGKVGLCKIWKR